MLATANRKEMLSRIAELESDLKELRANLPNPLKSFFLYRLTQPNTRMLVYAENREEADLKLSARVSAEYPNCEVSQAVTEFSDPNQAALNAGMGANLIDSLTPADADMFLADWKELVQTQPEALPKRPNQLTRDIEAYELRKRVEAFNSRTPSPRKRI